MDSALGQLPSSDLKKKSENTNILFEYPSTEELQSKLSEEKTVFHVKLHRFYSSHKKDSEISS